LSSELDKYDYDLPKHLVAQEPLVFETLPESTDVSSRHMRYAPRAPEYENSRIAASDL